MPELSKLIQGERDLSSNNRIIQISVGSNNCRITESTVIKMNHAEAKSKMYRLKMSFTFPILDTARDKRRSPNISQNTTFDIIRSTIGSVVSKYWSV